MNPNRFTLSARWVFPVAAAPIEFGKITIEDGQVVAVASGPSPGDLHLPDYLVIPGLVNAHTHLDLSGLRNQCPPSSDFTGWLKQVISHRRQQTPEGIQRDIQAGIDELLATGTTLVGDINVGGTSWELLERSPLRAQVYLEFLGLSEAAVARHDPAMGEWLTGTTDTSRIQRGISPHAPYSVGRSLFRHVSNLVSISSTPFAVHLAETEAELELLATHRGPFREFLESLGVWNESELVNNVEEVISLLWHDMPKLWVHANYLNPQVALPPNSTIVYCPRTHAAFGHRPHPFRDFLKRGVPVALGTDSLASNPDLDVLREALFVHDLYPDLPGETILRMVTSAGAMGLGFPTHGAIERGSPANLVAIPIGSMDGSDVHELIWDAVRRQESRIVLIEGIRIGTDRSGS